MAPGYDDGVPAQRAGSSGSLLERGELSTHEIGSYENWKTDWRSRMGGADETDKALYQTLENRELRESNTKLKKFTASLVQENILLRKRLEETVERNDKSEEAVPRKDNCELGEVFTGWPERTDEPLTENGQVARLLDYLRMRMEENIKLEEETKKLLGDLGENEKQLQIAIANKEELSEKLMEEEEAKAEALNDNAELRKYRDSLMEETEKWASDLHDREGVIAKTEKELQLASAVKEELRRKLLQEEEANMEVSKEVLQLNRHIDEIMEEKRKLLADCQVKEEKLREADSEYTTLDAELTENRTKLKTTREENLKLQRIIDHQKAELCLNHEILTEYRDLKEQKAHFEQLSVDFGRQVAQLEAQLNQRDDQFANMKPSAPLRSLAEELEQLESEDEETVSIADVAVQTADFVVPPTGFQLSRGTTFALAGLCGLVIFMVMFIYTEYSAYNRSDQAFGDNGCGRLLFGKFPVGWSSLMGQNGGLMCRALLGLDEFFGVDRTMLS